MQSFIEASEVPSPYMGERSTPQGSPAVRVEEAEVGELTSSPLRSQLTAVPWARTPEFTAEESQQPRRVRRAIALDLAGCLWR